MASMQPGSQKDDLKSLAL